MERFCLDTDFLVDFLRNKKYAVDFIEDNEYHAVLATTLVTLFELYRGAFKSREPLSNINAADRLLDRFAVLNLSNDSVKLAAKLKAKMEKEGNSIDIRDLFIGTIAVVNNLVMKTNNIKDFSRIDGLKIA